MRILIVALLLCLAGPAWAQSGIGLLSTPMNVATLGVTNSGVTLVVSPQGAGIKVRVLGFFLATDRENQITMQDNAPTPVTCTGRMTLATGAFANGPVAPPGWVCETTVNRGVTLNLRNAGIVGGTLMWQQAQ